MIALQLETDLLTSNFDITLMRYKPAVLQDCASPANKDTGGAF
jgi:hypothetical protein